jgi:hypothetical protein
MDIHLPHPPLLLQQSPKYNLVLQVCAVTPHTPQRCYRLPGLAHTLLGLARSLINVIL